MSTWNAVWVIGCGVASAYIFLYYAGYFVTRGVIEAWNKHANRNYNVFLKDWPK